MRCIAITLPHHLVKSKKMFSLTSTINRLGYLQMQLDMFSEHEHSHFVFFHRQELTLIALGVLLTGFTGRSAFR